MQDPYSSSKGTELELLVLTSVSGKQDWSSYLTDTTPSEFGWVPILADIRTGLWTAAKFLLVFNRKVRVVFNVSVTQQINFEHREHNLRMLSL